MKQITIENKKAYYDYFVLDSIECGIELKGHEVKSIRQGMCTLKDSYCYIKNGELFLTGTHITKYKTAMDFDIEENRDRKLLIHKQEIRLLNKKLIDNGITLIPLKVYFVNGRVKVLIGICRGKHSYDKRQSLKEKDMKRAINYNLKYE